MGGGSDGDVKITAEKISAAIIPPILIRLSTNTAPLEYFYSFPNLKRVYTAFEIFVQRGGEVRSSRRAHNPKISSSNLLPATFVPKTWNTIGFFR